MLNANKYMIIPVIANSAMCYYNFTTPRSITNYGSMLLQFAIGALLQFMTTVITIYDSYYKSRQLLLQFTTFITIHDSTHVRTFHVVTVEDFEILYRVLVFSFLLICKYKTKCDCGRPFTSRVIGLWASCFICKLRSRQ